MSLVETELMCFTDKVPQVHGHSTVRILYMLLLLAGDPHAPIMLHAFPFSSPNVILPCNTVGEWRMLNG
jgi:hypothetical protein